MKKLQNLVGAKVLSKKDQQAVKGGHNIPGPAPCWCGGRGTIEECKRMCEHL